jgi:glycosyltransferase involved in cell wall biosynthesis
MRVLYIHQYFVEPSGSGGTRSYEFARRLVADGHQVDMLTSTAFLDAPRHGDGGIQHFTVEGIEVTALPVAYGNRMGRLRRMFAYAGFSLRSVWIVARQRRPDVIVATSTPLTVAIPGILGRTRHRCPMVFEVRDLWPEVPIEMGYLRSRAAVRFAKLLAKCAYKASAEIVALSPGMEDGVRRVIGSTRNITVVPNAADCDLFDPSFEHSVPEWWPAPSGAFSAVYTGTFGRANDVAWVAEVASHLKNLSARPAIHFVLIGDGMDREILIRQIDELDVGDIVHLVDAMPKDTIPSALAASSACICIFAPVKLLETTSPNKFFDGLAAGRAVLINYGGWQEELLAEHDAGFRLDRDPARAAKQLESLAGDSARLASMGVNARRLAESRFDRDLLYERFRAVLTRASASK